MAEESRFHMQRKESAIVSLKLIHIGVGIRGSHWLEIVRDSVYPDAGASKWARTKVNNNTCQYHRTAMSDQVFVPVVGHSPIFMKRWSGPLAWAERERGNYQTALATREIPAECIRPGLWHPRRHRHATQVGHMVDIAPTFHSHSRRGPSTAGCARGWSELLGASSVVAQSLSLPS
jgi:hypothetical protein